MRLWRNDQSGGNVTIAPGGVGGFPSKAKLLTISQFDDQSERYATPSPILVQISSDFVDRAGTEVVTLQQIFADVTWQSGRGVQKATVDVGRGTSFTVAAAETLEVAVYVVAVSDEGTPVRVNGTCAPATAAHPTPAYLTHDEIITLATGVSQSFDVPEHARGFEVKSADLAAVSLILAEMNARAVGAGTNILYQSAVDDGPVPLFNDVASVRLSYVGAPGPATQATLLRWELVL